MNAPRLCAGPPGPTRPAAPLSCNSASALHTGDSSKLAGPRLVRLRNLLWNLAAAGVAILALLAGLSAGTGSGSLTAQAGVGIPPEPATPGRLLDAFLVATAHAADDAGSEQDAGKDDSSAAAGDNDAANHVEEITERGPVRARVRLDPAESRIGDAIEFTLEVSAEDGVDVLMPDFGRSLGRFQILDFAPSEGIDAQARSVFTQRYRLAPSGSGSHTIPPMAVEFIDRRPGSRPAPEGEDAFELLTEPLHFEVASVLPADLQVELEPPLGRLEKLGRRGGFLPWLLAGLFALACLSWPLWKLFRNRRSAAIQRSAWDVANTRLSALRARPAPDPDEVDAFFVELSDIVRHYLEDRFDLRSPELTTEEFLELATGSPDLTDSLRTLLREFLQTADMVKFAGLRPGQEDIRRTLDAAERFLDQTRSPEDQAAVGAEDSAGQKASTKDGANSKPTAPKTQQNGEDANV